MGEQEESWELEKIEEQKMKQEEGMKEQELYGGSGTKLRRRNMKD